MSAISSPGWQAAMWKQGKKSHSFQKIPIAKPGDVAPRVVPKISKPEDDKEDRPVRKSDTKLMKMLRGGKSKKKTKKKS